MSINVVSCGIGAILNSWKAFYHLFIRSKQLIAISSARRAKYQRLKLVCEVMGYFCKTVCI